MPYGYSKKVIGRDNPQRSFQREERSTVIETTRKGQGSRVEPPSGAETESTFNFKGKYMTSAGARASDSKV